MHFQSLLFITALLSFTCSRSSTSTDSASLSRDSSEMVTSVSVKQPAGQSNLKPAQPLSVGAAQLPEYLPLLSGKRVAMVVNHTSTVGNTHLVDTLLSKKVDIRKIFAPEHGFRGDASNGELVQTTNDPRTGLLLVSLYGSNKKPTAAQLSDVDVVMFDIQDVGARFFTYISTMHYVMEACAENNKQVIVLDRPNPHGHHVDGPVMQPAFKSFIGMHPIPVVHGLTVGELAGMINGEGWLTGGVKCNLQVIKNKGYTHQTSYVLPLKPSPNLPNQQAVRLYPSVCLMEGTSVSVGRGTDFPFQVVGSPDQALGTFTFTPRNLPGAKNPPYEGQLCYGMDLRKDTLNHFSLNYVIELYRRSSDKEKFFTKFFDKLAGNDKLRGQIQSGMSEAQIRETWQRELTSYHAMRKKYLLYAE